MKEIKIQGETSISRILIGESYKNLANYLAHDRVVVITDANLRKHYGGFINQYPVIEIGQGEDNKNMATLEFIFSRLIDLGADRHTFLLGIGGGIVCDITGFVASIFMRGMDFGFVSTSLLSQVDASVGGKNGVNFQGFKNMIGVFNQPRFVICDPFMLKTLPTEEISNGFAEIAKHALIADEEMFHFMERNAELALSLDAECIQYLVQRSIEIKSEIVRQDEKEKGERMKLNYGHTVGHAIEKLTKIPHGEAVSMGSVVANRLSERKGLLQSDAVLRIQQLLEKYNLPVKLNCSAEQISSVMQKDKKKEGDYIHYILLDKIGNARIEKLKLKELEDIINDLC